MNIRNVIFGSMIALGMAVPSLATTQYQISDIRLLRDAINSEAATAGSSIAALNPVPVAFDSRDLRSEAAELGVVDAEPVSWNQSGTVVGSAVTSQGRRFAFVWDQTNGMSDLNRIAPVGTSVQLEEGLSIDDSGRIIAKGLSSGEDAEFDLSPAQLSQAPVNRGVCGSLSGLDTAGGALGLILFSALSFTRRRRTA